MIIEIYTKNNALTQTIESVKGPIPRFGELLTLQQDGGYLQGVETVIVREVDYTLRDDELTPVIRCQPYFGEHTRSFLVKEFGWNGDS